MWRDIVFYAELAVQSALSVFGLRFAYEEPPYRVVERVAAVEIRAYGPRLAAEATLPAGPRARDEAFGLLAGYIFGANRGAAGSERIAMTTPVESAPSRIAMTTPVEAAAAEGGWRMRFFLPSGLTLATAPRPLDARVRILEGPGETLAVLGFSGVASRGRIDAEGAALLQALERCPWRPVGSAVPAFLGYDPPFTLPPLRRNEVAVAVERR